MFSIYSSSNTWLHDVRKCTMMNGYFRSCFFKDCACFEGQICCFSVLIEHSSDAWGNRIWRLICVLKWIVLFNGLKAFHQTFGKRSVPGDEHDVLIERPWILEIKSGCINNFHFQSVKWSTLGKIHACVSC